MSDTGGQPNDQPYTTSGVGAPDYAQMTREVVISQDNLTTLANLIAAGNQAAINANSFGSSGAAAALAQVQQAVAAQPFAFDTLFFQEPLRDTATHYGTSPVTVLQNRQTIQQTASGLLTQIPIIGGLKLNIAGIPIG